MVGAWQRRSIPPGLNHFPPMLGTEGKEEGEPFCCIDPAQPPPRPVPLSLAGGGRHLVAERLAPHPPSIAALSCSWENRASLPAMWIPPQACGHGSWLGPGGAARWWGSSSPPLLGHSSLYREMWCTRKLQHQAAAGGTEAVCHEHLAQAQTRLVPKSLGVGSTWQRDSTPMAAPWC